MYTKLMPESVIHNGSFTKVVYTVYINDIPPVVSKSFLDRYIENLGDTLVYRNLYDKINVRFKVVGTSRCSSDDEYDRLIGLDLAEYRAAVSAYTKVYKILNAIDMESVRLKIGIHDFQQEISSKVSDLETKIDDLLDETK